MEHDLNILSDIFDSYNVLLANIPVLLMTVTWSLV